MVEFRSIYTLQFSTIDYNPVLYSRLYGTIHNTVQDNTVLFSTIQTIPIQYRTVLQSTKQNKTTQYSFNTINVKLETLNTALKKYCRPIWTYGSARVEPAIPMCQASLLTTGLGRQSQQTNNNMLYL